VFRELAKRPELDFKVYFCQIPDEHSRGEGFGVGFDWDIPLLDGYQYEVLHNAAKEPSVTSFNGCDTPGIGKKLLMDKVQALVVNGWVVKSCLQGLRACEKLRIPCLVRGEANLLRKRPIWKQLAHRMLVRRYAACLTIGKANAEFYRKMGVPEERLFRSPYCVENDRFAAHARQSDGRRRLRAQYNIPEDAVVFVFCGKFIEKKHPVELIRAFGRAVWQDAKAHLLMVGDGELKPLCEMLVKSNEWPVSLTGFVNQSQIADAYLAGDCLVLPSDHGETWGLVVNEAMACGRPALVSTQVGCAADLIVKGVTGTTFPFGNWNVLTDRLVAAAQSPARLAEMGPRAAAHIAAYSPAAAADGIVEAALAVKKGRLSRD
jgi:glycosyltransferase involved in cell wall biosynthesis